MLLKMKKIEVSVFELEEDFYVEVIPSESEEGLFDFWLAHKDYGIKDSMFGVYCEVDQIPDMIINNVTEYIAIYKESYFDNHIDE